MRTPITYYGGKLSMVSQILPLIPTHTIYTEAFFGGGAIFFAKESAQLSVINDTNHFVTVFYTVLRTQFNELKQMIDCTLYSRKTCKVAQDIYDAPHLFDKLHQAWAFWVVTSQGFSGAIGSWSYALSGNKVKTLNRKKLRFTKELAEKLEQSQIENSDALKVIKSRDTPKTFHFIDPPYIDADQGHYGGYTKEDFTNLLEALATVKGTFLLTTYDSELLSQYVKKHGWKQIKINKPLTAYASKDGEKRKRKIEVLTMNYSI